MNSNFAYSMFLDDEQRAKRAFLTKLPIFKNLHYSDFTYLLRTLQEHTYLKGETLFEESDIGRALFIVISGRINIYRSIPGGGTEKIACVEQGELFGEMALLEEMPRTGSAVADENTRVYMLFKSKLDSLLYSHPRIGVVITHYLAQTLSARLRAQIEAQNLEQIK
ncbi:MAG: cyclic nucleotide-binding domain-containing protein [Elusimicrobiaceae bacterium]|nr:cyclic nucleotide-binding domain-containing protein [Elusimicrobiaceae bacterium]